MMSKQIEFSHREIPFGAYDQQSRFTLPAQAFDPKLNSATQRDIAFECTVC